MEQSMVDFGHQEEEPLTEIELEVADFMEHLRFARLQPDPDPAPLLPPRRLPYSWGLRRRRSAVDQSPSPPTVKKAKVDAASSPATTLAFPPSESEEKLLQQPMKTTLSKLPKKMEELQDRVDSETSHRQTLLQEVAKVQCYRDKLKEENIRLKEMLRVVKEKQQLCLEPEPEPMALSTSVGFNHHQVPYIVLHQQPLILDQTTARERRNGLLQCSSGVKGFNLNLPPAEAAAEAPPLDACFWSTEMAAQARMNRLNRKRKIQGRNNSGEGAPSKSTTIR